MSLFFRRETNRSWKRLDLQNRCADDFGEKRVTDEEWMAAMDHLEPANTKFMLTLIAEAVLSVLFLRANLEYGLRFMSYLIALPLSISYAIKPNKKQDVISEIYWRAERRTLFYSLVWIILIIILTTECLVEFVSR